MKFFLREDYKDDFLTRTQKHIDLVCKYGKKIGQDYSEHDNDKLSTLFDDYALMLKKDHFGGANSSDNLSGLTDKEKERLNKATTTHITRNAHHPEHWCDEEIEDFDRENPPQGVHCEKMPYDAIDEMCCDWAACSEEFGTNTPQEWMKKTVPSRWIFSEEQVEYMKKLLNKLWEE